MAFEGGGNTHSNDGAGSAALDIDGPDDNNSQPVSLGALKYPESAVGNRRREVNHSDSSRPGKWRGRTRER